MPTVPGYFDPFGNWISSEGRPAANAAMPPIQGGPVHPSVQPPTTQPPVQQPPVTAQEPTKIPQDPFTSWMSQQGLFPYSQIGGWNPSMGYNPSVTGYNPASMPNYSMDQYL